MSLNDDLAELKEKLVAQLPADMVELALADLKRAVPLGSQLQVGDRVSDFALANREGRTVRLEELRQGGPVVISFYSGTWCSFCNLELLALQQNLYEITRLRSSLVALSPQKGERASAVADQQQITFELLQDTGNRVARDFGLVVKVPESFRQLLSGIDVDLEAENGDDLYELPVPATYVVDDAGLIHYAFADPDFIRRADPIDIIHVLRDLRSAKSAASQA